MLDKDLCSLFQSLFGVNRPVGSNLQVQLLVVGLLLDTVVVDGILYVLDRREDRVDREGAELALGGGILLCRNVAAPLADREGHLHLRAGREVADHQIGVQHLEERKVI